MKSTLFQFFKHNYKMSANRMIIEFEPDRVLLSSPPLWKLYYKLDYEPSFHSILVTKERLIAFLETHGYESNQVDLLRSFGVNTCNIKWNTKL
jgi:hypothetical protein